MIDRRIAICVIGSIAAHLLAGEALSTLPERAVERRKRTIEVRIVEPRPAEPEPPPELEPPPEPAQPPPKVVERVEPRPRPRPVPASAAESPPTTAPTQVAPAATEHPGQPVFGVAMESTTTAGSGPVVPVGNTTAPSAPVASPPSSRSPTAPAHEVTKMPLPRGRCSGTYTDAAREAGIEGVVVLDLVVDEQGRARDITVVEGLPQGLTEAALTALRDCTFTPGERAGVAVPVRVRGFKIRFVLDG